VPIREISKPIIREICRTDDKSFVELMPDHEYLRGQIDVHDRASRIHPKLYTKDGIEGLQRLLNRYGIDRTLETIIGAVSEPGSSEKEMHGIRTWRFFLPILEENVRREQLREAGIAPGDVLGLGMKMDIPF
jgi:hypothetical protein